jgi:peptide/nickel transport system substrate-binding protein
VIPRRLPAYVAGVLRALGYRTTLHRLPLASITAVQRRRFQLSIDGDWLPDYPTPSSYLPDSFGCHGGQRPGYGCDRRLDRHMQNAATLQVRDPVRAARVWTRVDHALTDRAMWVPTVNVQAPELVSRRVRNYQYHPVWGFIADQVWLR